MADEPYSGRPPNEIPETPDVDIQYAQLEIGERIGAGGNADVFRARLPTPDGFTDIAVKQPRIDGTIGQQIVEQFIEEAETWAQLDDNDYIVGVVDFGSEPMPWIAMEYMDGGDLQGLIQQTEMSLAQRAWTAGRVLEAVHHAHRHGVVHLDLKPANVLLRTTGKNTWPVPKVGDWGLAKLLLDHSGSIEGLSPEYAAPEQFDAGQYGTPDDLTDLYQLGVVCYELFTGKPPFEGRPPEVMQAVLNQTPDPPTSVNSSLPASIDAPIMNALEKKKANRQDSVLLFREELRGAFDSELESKYSADSDGSRRQMLKYVGITGLLGIAGGAWFARTKDQNTSDIPVKNLQRTVRNQTSANARGTDSTAREISGAAQIVETFESGVGAWEKVKGNEEDKMLISEQRSFSGHRSLRVRNQPSGSGPTAASDPGDGLEKYPTYNGFVSAAVTFDNADAGRYNMAVKDKSGNGIYVNCSTSHVYK
jgi:serine/threonine protein kinase